MALMVGEIGRQRWNAVGASLLLMFLAWFLALTPARADGRVVIDPRTGKAIVGRALEVMEDPSRRLTLEDVSTPHMRGEFQPVDNESPSFGFTQSAYWLRFSVSGMPDGDPNLVLEVAYRGLDELDFYIPAANGGFIRKQAGDLLPFSIREIGHRLVSLPFSIKSGETETYYMRVASEGPVVIPLIVWTAAAFGKHDHQEQMALGMFYGALLVMLIYNLILFFSLRDRSYLSFVAFLTGYGLCWAVENGIAFESMWPDWPWWDNRSFPFLVAFTSFWGIKFCQDFLNVRKRTPRFYGALRLNMWGSGLLAVLALFAPYRYAMPFATLLILTGTLSVLAAGVAGARKGYRPAKYFLISWSTVLIGGMVAALFNFGLLPLTTLTYYGGQIGAGLQFVLLSLGLADRITDLRLEKESAELESNIDGLTGIANRRHFDNYLSVEWQRAIRDQVPLSLLMIDIDFFKNFNDAYGHLSGDACLQALAKALGGALKRPSDLLSRYGGEEFAVVLPNTDCAGAQVVAGQLHQVILGLAIPHADSVVAKVVTATLGVATAYPLTGTSADMLIAAADKALYDGKKEGRNRIRVEGALKAQSASRGRHLL